MPEIYRWTEDQKMYDVLLDGNLVVNPLLAHPESGLVVLADPQYRENPVHEVRDYKYRFTVNDQLRTFIFSSRMGVLEGRGRVEIVPKRK